MKTIRCLFLLALFFTSCAVYRTGNVSSGPLLDITDKYVGVACGDASAKIQGEEGYSKELLITQAKMNMYKNRPLGNGEYYSNFILNIEVREKWLHKSIVTMAVCADVLRQRSGSDSLPFSKEYNETVVKESQESSFKVGSITYKLGETIYTDAGGKDGELSAMEIISIIGKTVNLRHLISSKPAHKIDYTKQELFSTGKSLNGFTKGDEVKITSTSNKKETISGVVLAANETRIVVSSEIGIYSYAPERLVK